MVICWHQKQLRQRCVWTPNESSGMLEKRYVQAFKIIGTGNLLVISLPSVFFFLFFLFFAVFGRRGNFQWSASVRQSFCINRKVLLSFFPLSPSLPRIPFSQIIFHSPTFFAYFLNHGTVFFIPMRATSHLTSSLRRNLVPDHWNARTRRWPI